MWTIEAEKRIIGFEKVADDAFIIDPNDTLEENLYSIGTCNLSTIIEEGYVIDDNDNIYKVITN